MRLSVVVVVIVLRCARAHADEKNPAVAVMLSAGVPTLGVVAIAASDSGGGKLLGASALLVGPSTGRWYAGDGSTTGILVRCAGGVAAIVGVAMLVSASEADCVADDTPCSSQGSQKTIGGALAHTQPGMTPPTKRPVVEAKSPAIAMGVSIGIPVAGALTMAFAPKGGEKALGFLAMYVGPTTGQWYAGKGGGLGLGLRLLSIAGAVGALMLVVDEECDLDEDCEATPNDDFAATLVVGAAGLWVGSSIYDVVLAKRAVERWNHNLTLMPGLVGNQHAPGVFLGGHF